MKVSPTSSPRRAVTVSQNERIRFHEAAQPLTFRGKQWRTGIGSGSQLLEKPVKFKISVTDRRVEALSYVASAGRATMFFPIPDNPI